MTKQLHELFDMPIEESVSPDTPAPIEQKFITKETLTNIEKIENALPQVKGLDATDGEMDELADLAKESYNQLMDLGMQVDSRFASEIFNSAGTMLGHAITAKTAKINKKLKMIDLQLKKAGLDMKSDSKVKEIENTPIGEGSLLDRNELLKSLMANLADIMLLIMELFTEKTWVPEVGKFYTFIYNPKTPDIEYDQHPLIACTEIQKWGFRGMNFHWRKYRNYTDDDIIRYAKEVKSIAITLLILTILPTEKIPVAPAAIVPDEPPFNIPAENMYAIGTYYQF